MGMLGYDGKVPNNWDAIPHIEGLQHVTRGNPSMRGTHPSKDGFFGPASAELTPSAGAIIDRLQTVFGVNSDVALAEKLGLARKSTNNWRSREYRPLDTCLEVAMERGLSLDWLVLGVGEPQRGASPAIAHDPGSVPAGHLALPRLAGFDASGGPDLLVFPEASIRRRAVNADMANLRWMVNPTEALAPRLPQGALLLVDTSVNRHDDVVDGETYVVRTWGRVNVRRVFIIGSNEYRLRGDQEREERRDLTGPDYMHFEVGGRVLDVI